MCVCVGSAWVCVCYVWIYEKMQIEVKHETNYTTYIICKTKLLKSNQQNNNYASCPVSSHLSYSDSALSADSAGSRILYCSLSFAFNCNSIMQNMSFYHVYMDMFVFVLQFIICRWMNSKCHTFPCQLPHRPTVTITPVLPLCEAIIIFTLLGNFKNSLCIDCKGVQSMLFNIISIHVLTFFY